MNKHKIKEKLFIYGTLKNPRVQKEVFGRTAEGKADSLVGYNKSEIVIGAKTYPVIIPDSKSFIKGQTISVTAEELKLIDEYETDAYKRVKVVLESGDRAWVYIKNQKNVKHRK